MAKGKPDIVFSPPIEMDLGNNPGKVHFKKLSTFHKWLNTDISFWAEIDDKLKILPLPQELKLSFNEALENRNQLKQAGQSSIEAITSRHEIERILNAFAEGKLIHSDTDIATHMANLSDRNLKAELTYYYIAAGSGALLVKIASGGNIDLNPLLRAFAQIEVSRGPIGNIFAGKMNDLVNQAQDKYDEIVVHALEAVQSYNEAHELVNGTNGIRSQVDALSGDLERHVSEALAPHQARIETALKDARSQVTKAQKAFNAASETMRESFDIQVGDLEVKTSERLDGFVQSAKDRLNFKVVENFWDKKRKRHLGAWIGFGVSFIVGIAAAIACLVVYGVDYLILIGVFDATRKLANTEFNLPLALFATLPVIGVFWILRQFLKLFLVNLA